MCGRQVLLAKGSQRVGLQHGRTKGVPDLSIASNTSEPNRSHFVLLEFIYLADLRGRQGRPVWPETLKLPLGGTWQISSILPSIPPRTTHLGVSFRTPFDKLGQRNG